MESEDQLIFGAEEGEPLSPSDQQRIRTIANMIGTMAKEKIEEQTKHREQELAEQKILVAQYVAKCDKLQETVKSLENEKIVLEQELQRRGQDEETVESLNIKLQKSDLRCQLLESEYKKLFAKHQKLRQSLSLFATCLQEFDLTNVPQVGTSHGTLAALSEHANKRLEKMESNRKDLQEMSRKNSVLLSSIEQILKINVSKASDELLGPLSPTRKQILKVIKPKIFKEFSCSACAKVLPSWRNLLEHRLNVHTVQNSKKFLQRKRSSRVKISLKESFGDSKWNIVPSSPSLTNEMENLRLVDDCDAEFAEVSTLIIPHTGEEEQRSKTSLESTQLLTMNDPHNSCLHEVDEARESDGYFCRCRYKATTRSILTRHIQYHNMEKKFTCEICQLTFRKEKEKRRHLLVKHQVKTPGPSLSLLQCTSCGMGFRKRNLLTRHIRAAHGKISESKLSDQEMDISLEQAVEATAPLTSSPAPCPESGEKTVRLTRSKSRIGIANKVCIRPREDARHDVDKRHCGSQGFFCTCGRKSPNRAALIRHIRHHNPTTMFHCPSCPVSYARYTRLKRHMCKKHQIIIPGFGCSYCGKILANGTELCEHQTTMGCRVKLRKQLETVPRIVSVVQSKVKNVASPRNPKRTDPPKERLSVTIRKHELDRSKRHAIYCRCGSRYSNAKALEKHIKYFTQERKYECQFCFRVFAYHCKMMGHIKKSHKSKMPRARVARVEKSKSLEVTPIPSSDAPTSSSSAQSSSSSSSKDELKLICSSVRCPIEHFTTTHALKLNYSEDNPNEVQCKCGLRFGNKDTLNAHIRFYSFQKCFLCSWCQEAFSSFQNMNAHIRGNHNTEPDPNHLGCPSCGVVFANKQEYRRHMIMTINDQKKFQGRCCPMVLVEQRKEIAKETTST